MLRNLRAGEAGLSADEQALLDRICEAYYLPAWCSIDDYRRIFEAKGLQARVMLSIPSLTGCLPHAAVHGGACCQQVLAACWRSWAPSKCCHILLQDCLLWSERRAALVCPASCFSLASWSSSRWRNCILPQRIKIADWSEEVAPFWGAVIRSALSAEGFSGLFKAGWTTIKARGEGACALYHGPAVAAWFCMCVLHDAGSCLTSGEALLVCRVHW